MQVRSVARPRGATPQGPDSVALKVRNYRGELRQAVYSPAMEPFSLHKLQLGKLFAGLDEFCGGKHATLEGQFAAKDVFSRPYVMTEGKHIAGYHGGNRYQWSCIPRFIYKALGCGEVNPMAAIHSETLTTTVNLLNSHGNLEDDFWVDARLYDRSGREVANRKRTPYKLQPMRFDLPGVDADTRGGADGRAGEPQERPPGAGGWPRR